MSTKLLILFAVICVRQTALAVQLNRRQAHSFRGGNNNRDIFAADLFKQISKDKINENVIISPTSIQIAMTMTYLGAEGETATELKKGLRFRSNNKDSVARYILRVLRKFEGEIKLSIANKIYISSKYKLRSTYNDLLTKYFNSEAETLDFSQSADAVKTINSWIEKATNDKITNIMQPGSVDGETSALIVNAIYFKGNWDIPFSKDSTRKGPFWVNKTKSVDTDFMFNHGLYKFGYFRDLDATAIELVYKDSDLSMLIILPKERDGLAKLEDKLSSVSFNDLSSRMNLDVGEIYLPKFKIEFSTSMTDALKTMGIRSIFDDNANLSGIFESGPPIKVSDVHQKVCIDVNEAGTEAAAATTVSFFPRSETTFNADHPFVFAIKSRDTVYFLGHIAQF